MRDAYYMCCMRDHEGCMYGTRDAYYMCGVRDAYYMSKTASSQQTCSSLVLSEVYNRSFLDDVLLSGPLDKSLLL